MALTQRWLTVAGGGAHDGTSEADAWTLAEAITGMASATNTLVNVKAGTYANTTTSRTIPGAGTATAPNWWRGYNTTPGDIDLDYSLPKPLWTFTTGALTFSGSYFHLSHLQVTSQRTAGAAVQFGNNNPTHMRIDNCDVENTGTNALSAAVLNASVGGHNSYTRCNFKATTSASVCFDAARSWSMTACKIEGGASGVVFTNNTTAVRMKKCLVLGQTSYNISIPSGANTAASLSLNDCVLRGAGSDAIRYAQAIMMMELFDNLFYQPGGYCLNNATGATVSNIHRDRNAYYQATSGFETGFGDVPNYNTIQHTNDPFENAGRGIYLPTDASVALGYPIPGPMATFPGSPLTPAYGDVGMAPRKVHTPAEIEAAMWDYFDRTTT